jgi:hypothetical protein
VHTCMVQVQTGLDRLSFLSPSQTLVLYNQTGNNRQTKEGRAKCVVLHPMVRR